MTITPIKTPRGTKCAGCGVNLQGGGYVIANDISKPLCWWCANGAERIEIEQEKEPA